MWGMQNGKERELEDWEKLFSEADQRLSLTKVIRPVQSRMAVLEARLTNV